MSQVTCDHAPGDIPEEESTHSSGLLVYTIGLLLAVALTGTSFWVANTHLLWGPGTPFGLAVLAIAQMSVHLVFFLHITAYKDSTNNFLALAFGVLVVVLIVTGSLVIVDDLKMTTGSTASLSMPGR